MHLIKCQGITEEQALERMGRGIRGIIRGGSNPYPVTAAMRVKVTPVMEGVFLMQLMKGVETIACGYTSTGEF